MTFALRPATEKDIETMQALERDAYEAFRAVGYDFCVGPVREDWEHRKGISGGASLMAESSGKPAGFILAWPVDGHGHIVEVSVAMAFQKRGLGRADRGGRGLGA